MYNFEQISRGKPGYFDAGPPLPLLVTISCSCSFQLVPQKLAGPPYVLAPACWDKRRPDSPDESNVDIAPQPPSSMRMRETVKQTVSCDQGARTQAYSPPHSTISQPLFAPSFAHSILYCPPLPADAGLFCQELKWNN